jgi:predicted AAA+ superfamily ATPase
LRQLPPWFENLGNRQYKAPKVYVRDSGLLHALLSVQSQADLEGHPKYGASWEGFALEQVLSVVGAEQSFFWGTHAGAEIDLLLIRRGRRYAVEFKASAAPEMTRSLHVALADLKLDRAWMVYPGNETYPVHNRVEATSLEGAMSALAPLGASRR